MGEITDNWSPINTRMSEPTYTSFPLNTSIGASIQSQEVRAPVNKIVKETSYPGGSEQQLHPFADRVAIHEPNSRQPSQEKRHRCIICTKIFRSKGTFKTHLLRHYPETEFHCGICPTPFKREAWQYRTDMFNAHMANRHKKQVSDVAANIQRQWKVPSECPVPTCMAPMTSFQEFWNHLCQHCEVDENQANNALLDRELARHAPSDLKQYKRSLKHGHHQVKKESTGGMRRNDWKDDSHTDLDEILAPWKRPSQAGLRFPTGAATRPRKCLSELGDYFDEAHANAHCTPDSRPQSAKLPLNSRTAGETPAFPVASTGLYCDPAPMQRAWTYSEFELAGSTRRYGPESESLELQLSLSLHKYFDYCDVLTALIKQYSTLTSAVERIKTHHQIVESSQKLERENKEVVANWEAMYPNGLPTFDLFMKWDHYQKEVARVLQECQSHISQYEAWQSERGMDNQATYQHHAAGFSAEKEESCGILLPMPESSTRSKPAPPDQSTQWRSMAHENMSKNAYDPDFSDDNCTSLVAKGQPLDTVRRWKFPLPQERLLSDVYVGLFKSTEIGKDAVRPVMMQREKPLYATQHKRIAYPHQLGVSGKRHWLVHSGKGIPENTESVSDTSSPGLEMSNSIFIGATDLHGAVSDAVRYFQVRRCAIRIQERTRPVKSDPKLTVEEQWYAIWKILFPGVEPPSAPYIDGALSEEISSFQEFYQTKGPIILRLAFQADDMDIPLSQELQQHSDLVLRAALDKILDEWLLTQTDDASSSSAQPATSATLSPSSDNNVNPSPGGSQAALIETRGDLASHTMQAGTDTGSSWFSHAFDSGGNMLNSGELDIINWDDYDLFTSHSQVAHHRLD
ncbi:hypothetical protein BJX66DRAFT_335846 [Aspergillus keveii]|uniref:C2H2-type domain-containing protein n=1 Tax=Aspergillus keveii TaxID=714993 RepID=A0ABR4GC43_9EURO